MGIPRGSGMRKNGELRLCVDYRRLNAVTKFDTYLMSRIEELIDRVGRRSLSPLLLDLTTGYWQVPISTKDWRKTAFATPFGTFQFNVMPFGLSGAPATFQSLMDRLLRGCEDFAVAYIDEFAILSDEWKDHINHLQEVLTRLENAGLTVKLSKSKFAMQSCEYLRHSIGNGVIKPIFDKIEAVRSFPTPDTKTAVRTFLGITGYYRRFILHFASVAAPLTDLTKKSAPNIVLWSEECERALCMDPVLISPDLAKRFVLQTDASDRGVGVMLTIVNSEQMVTNIQCATIVRNCCHGNSTTPRLKGMLTHKTGRRSFQSVSVR